MEQRAARRGPGAARSAAQRLLGHLTGVDPQAIWEWGFVERVSTGLLAMQVGAEQVGRQLLKVAHHWVQP
jgi:streptomycin 6-kinase